MKYLINGFSNGFGRFLGRFFGFIFIIIVCYFILTYLDIDISSIISKFRNGVLFL